ncbi:MAG: sodium:proton antiporter NhaD, partial [Magnetococcales bacterium]|nr:sodium:proton antiporter NhaD [Magnetococcales bacterium]
MNRPTIVITGIIYFMLGSVDTLWAAGNGGEALIPTNSAIGLSALLIFVLAYTLVMAEEFIHLRKSKPVLMAAGLIWVLIGSVYASHGMSHTAETALRHNVLEYSELFLFLLVAMTYINAMEERLVFDTLRSWLI